MVYYAALKWKIADGPHPSHIANDLQVLAMTLIAEHDWSLESVEDAFNGAIDAAQEQAMEITAAAAAANQSDRPA